MLLLLFSLFRVLKNIKQFSMKYFHTLFYNYAFSCWKLLLINKKFQLKLLQ